MSSYSGKYYVILVIGLILVALSVVGFITASKVVDAYNKVEGWTFVEYDKDGKPLEKTANAVLKQANETFTDRGASALDLSGFGLFAAMYRLWIGIPGVLLVVVGVVGIIKNRKLDQ